jgi:lipoprotein-releasing system permease protein
MSGFDHDLREKILGFNAHLTITQPGSSLKNYSVLADKISRFKTVKGASPFILGPVMVQTEGPTNLARIVDAPMLRGVDSESEGKISKLPEQIVDGEFNLGGHGLVIGSNFAENLHLRVGDHLSIFSMGELNRLRTAHNQNGETQNLPDSYEVRGIFNTGYFEYDSRVICTSLENAQDLYDLNDSVHGLFVMLDDAYHAPAVKRELEKSFGTSYIVSTWMDQNSGILNALIVEKNVMFYLLFFIVLVAALCILSAQITFVVQKTREIGMLKALGASNLQISGIFLAQSAVIGVIGVACGYGLGMLAVRYRNEFLHFMRNATGWELFPASVYGFGELPALVTPNDVAIICVSSFFICIFGGVLPAWRAGHLKPVEALRYE